MLAALNKGISILVVVLACNGLLLAKAKADGPVQEAISLAGEPLYRLSVSAERRPGLEANLAAAEAELTIHPTDPEAYVWVGRRIPGYLGRYGEAISMFTSGMDKFPDDARLYRHRGHRYISIRKFDEAVADLEHAAELIEGTENQTEPDGAPNPRGIPISTLHGNIYYHLALARYLQGDYDAALPVYLHALRRAPNMDGRISLTHWLYSTLRHLGKDEDAQMYLALIPSDASVIENHAYLDLILMYKGEKTAAALMADGDGGSSQNIAIAYGVANYLWLNGDREKATGMMEAILATGAWNAFGYIAAEADMIRNRP